MREQVIRRVKYVLPPLARLLSYARALVCYHLISSRFNCVAGFSGMPLAASERERNVLPSFFVTATRFKLSLEIGVAKGHI